MYIDFHKFGDSGDSGDSNPRDSDTKYKIEKYCNLSPDGVSSTEISRNGQRKQEVTVFVGNVVM
jgi:hypothetical protein